MIVHGGDSYLKLFIIVLFIVFLMSMSKKIIVINPEKNFLN